jgi:hypothetical protein
MTGTQRAQRLGWLSIGLGLVEVVAPHRLEQLLRINNQRVLLRTLGVRELVTGGGILLQHTPTAWIWARVAGDVLDLALLLAARGSDPVQRSRIAGTAGVVVAIGMVDLVCAQQLSKL